MPTGTHNTVSMAGGIVSPKLDARVDQQKYGSWLRQCLNMIPYKSGGLTRRVGTQMIAPAKLANTGGHDYAVTVLPFVFSPQTTFTLEFGHHYIRFYSNGVQVMVNSAATWVTATNYPAGSFVTDPFNSLIYYSAAGINGGVTQPHADAAHWVQQTIYEVPSPYNADSSAIFGTDVFALYPCQINDVMYIATPNWPPYKLTRLGDTNWTMQQVAFLAPALLDQNATDTIITPSALINAYGSSIDLIASAPAWAAIKFYTLANSVEVTGVIYNCIVQHVSTASFANDLAAGKWQSVVIFNSGTEGSMWQLAVNNQAGYIEYDGVAATGFANGTSSIIQCLGGATVNTYGVWSSDIQVQQSFDGGNTWINVITITSRSDNNASQKITAKVLSQFRLVISNSAALVNPGATNPRVTFTVDNTTLYGLATILTVATAYHATATVITQLTDSNPLQPQWISNNAYTAGNQVSYNFINYTAAHNVTSTTPPPNDTTNWTPNSPGGTALWSESAWSNFRGFPVCVASFQQRVIYAASGFEPQRIWGTVQNDIENFALGDQTLATDAFAFDLNAPGRGPVQWLIAQNDLFAGLSLAEWLINSGASSSTGSSSGTAITPTNINAVEQGTYGSGGQTPPCIVGNAVFFLQRKGDAIRQMLFSVYTAKYMSQDLTFLAENLFSSRIAKLAYQGRWRKQGILWVVTAQGTLCGLTYDLDQEVFGWCLAQTGFGQVDPSGNPITADNGFECVSVIPGKGTNDDEVWVVVNRLIGGVQTRFIERINPANWEESFTVAPTAPAPSLPDAYYVDCGLTVLSPGTLTITGLSHLNGRYVVGLADGNAFGPLLVAAGSVTLPASIPANVAKVQIGLPIMYAGQPMRFDSDPREGNTQGRTKQVSDVFLRLFNSIGGSISNGTATYVTWISGNSYAVGTNVISPLTKQAYQCVIAYSGATDPSASASWVQTTLSSYQSPIPIPYTSNQANPFAVPTLITTPTDIRITPQINPVIDTDPVVVVQGNDALPLTVLGLTIKYSVISKP